MDSETEKPSLHFVVYRDEGFETWIARCLNTGHTSMASSKEIALRCLALTVDASLRAHLDAGQSLTTWAGRYALRQGESIPGADLYDESRADTQVLESGTKALVCW